MNAAASGLLLVFASLVASASADQGPDPGEPIFTQRAFLDQTVELGVGWAKDGDGDELEVSVGLELMFWNRLEVDLDLPVGISIPDDGATVADLSDVGFGLQWLLCCESPGLLNWLSLRGEVEAPTGDRSKDIGGDGEWGVSILPGRFFPLGGGLPELLVQGQFGYAQQIRLDDEENAAAEAAGVSKTLEKEVGWNLAFGLEFLDGVVVPTFEVLGTTVVDSVLDEDEGTIVELSAGVWVAPKVDVPFLSTLAGGVGFKLPVTSLKDDQSFLQAVVEWGF